MGDSLVFMFYKFPLILSWLYLFVAVFCVEMYIKCDRKGKQAVVNRVCFGLNGAYIALFSIMRLFFFVYWERTFSVLGLLFLLLAFIWSRYEDRRSGRRWWNW